MTTSVQVNAYCDEDTEVIIREGDGGLVVETILLNNELWEANVSGHEFISIQERKCLQPLKTEGGAADDPFEEYRGG